MSAMDLRMGRHDNDTEWRRAWSQGAARPLPPIRRPLFLVGTVRSGTTLLAKCMGAHPQICYVGFEMNRAWCDLGDVKLAVSGNMQPHCPPLGHADAGPDRIRKIRAGFAEIFACEGGLPGARFLNKNPHLCNKLGFLQAAFPDASVIVASRDVRSSVASVKQLWRRAHATLGTRYYLPRDPEYCWTISPPASADGFDPDRTFPGGKASILAEYWLRTYEMIDRTSSGFQSVVPVSHTDVVADPHAALAGICAALDIPVVSMPLPDSMDRSRNDRWRRILTTDEQADLERFIERHEDRINRLRCADARR